MPDIICQKLKNKLLSGAYDCFMSNAARGIIPFVSNVAMNLTFSSPDITVCTFNWLCVNGGEHLITLGKQFGGNESTQYPTGVLLLPQT